MRNRKLIRRIQRRRRRSIEEVHPHPQNLLRALRQNLLQMKAVMMKEIRGRSTLQSIIIIERGKTIIKATSMMKNIDQVEIMKESIIVEADRALENR